MAPPTSNPNRQPCVSFMPLRFTSNGGATQHLPFMMPPSNPFADPTNTDRKPDDLHLTIWLWLANENGCKFHEPDTFGLDNDLTPKSTQTDLRSLHILSSEKAWGVLMGCYVEERCSGLGGSSCGFFKWCPDNTIADSLPVLVNTTIVYETNEMSSKKFGIRSRSQCFRCGKDGHWAKDCLLPSIQNPPHLG